MEGQEKTDVERGMLSQDSYIVFEAPSSSGIKVLLIDMWADEILLSCWLFLLFFVFVFALFLCYKFFLYVQIINQREAASSNIFKHKEFNLQSLGIGGLSNEFADIFRRAFASRVFPPHVASK